MDTLRIRVYNVRFGDALLVCVPERSASGRLTVRRLLIDFGNVLGGAGGGDAFFEVVVRDILNELNGRPLDLYVMTHAHLDHVQGLPYAAERLGLRLPARCAWLTGSAAPDYYERHPQARQERLALRDAYAAIERFVGAFPERQTPAVQTLLRNNNPARTDDCVAFLRQMAPKTCYVYRGCDLSGAQPFREARFSIWAPEEDTRVYYGRLQPMALGASAAPAGGFVGMAQIPPAGVDAGAFHDLVELRRSGWLENLLGIDRAANNTSVVFCLEWRGWRLLFAGDAERRSWQTMSEAGVLGPVHFLKVAYHGSINGTPDQRLLEALLPATPADGRPRWAAVSTYPDTYAAVPDGPTLEELGRRATLRSVVGLPDAGWIDFTFAG